MDGFSVTPSALAAAAASATVVGDGIEGVGVGAALVRLGAVLPGSATATTAGALAVRWDESTRALAREMTTHAGRLAGSASSYDSTDITVAAGLRTPG